MLTLETRDYSDRHADQDASEQEQEGSMRNNGNKFNNTPILIDGHWFQSMKEGRRFQELALMQKGGLIRDLRMQVPYPLIVNGEKVGVYLADFVYVDTATGETITEDVKGVATATYRLKKKLMFACHRIRISEV